MNTYVKYCPNVFIADCDTKHEKGETILVTTRHGKENESIVFNLIGEKNGRFFYSIVRADGFNTQEWAKRKAEKLQSAANNAEKKSIQYYEASKEGKEFLVLAEPIKIGHHSEKSHRALIDRNWSRMGKCVEFGNKADELESRAGYWLSRENDINLSMPESLEFYEFKLEQAKEKHEAIKNGVSPREHSYSLTYAKKEVNELEKKLTMAKKLWA
jgi:Domain of unknown function (DUF3560)